MEDQRVLLIIKDVFSDLIRLRIEVWNRLFSNRLFSQNKKYIEATESMVVTDSTQDIC